MSIRHLIRTVGLALVAVLTVSAVAVASASAVEGPFWAGDNFACTKLTSTIWKFSTETTCIAGTPEVTTGTWERILGAGGKSNITFAAIGATKLEGGPATIECASAKQGAAPNEVIGGSPGSGKITIEFKSCVAVGFCSVHNEGGSGGTINVKVNEEAIWLGTKAQAEKEEGPVGVVFKTLANGNKSFVNLVDCLGKKYAITANGTEKAPAIEGVAGVVCEGTSVGNVVKTTINCPETVITKYFYNNSGTVTEGKAEILNGGTKASQIGEGGVELESKTAWREAA